ncbi:hypothetical protein F5879DRAFT_994308 [Lentinula edodes]|nr:hypothetical protein F5879DRAFT_994308 [Lentinula edodes]
MESHARYSFEKLTALNKQTPHPGHKASEWADHPVDVNTGHQPHQRSSPPNTTIPDHAHAMESLTRDASIGQDAFLPAPNPHHLHLDKPDNAGMVDIDEGSEEPAKNLGGRKGGGLDAECDSMNDEGLSDEEGGLSEDEAGQHPHDPMVVDSLPTSALSPQQALYALARFNTLVEPIHHLKARHFKPEHRLPKNTEFPSLFTAVDADELVPVPVGPIPRIRGIKIIQGLKCAVAECFGTVFGLTEGKSRSLRRYQLQEHPRVAIADRCSIQVICQPTLIEKAAASCNLLKHGKSRWVEVLEGVNLVSLMATVSTAKCEAFVCAILKWFGELDDIVRSLYYLISTTWGVDLEWTSSAALVTKLEMDEKKCLAAQVKRLGPEGIKAAAKELEEVKVEHDKPLPTTVLTQCQIPDTCAMHPSLSRRMGHSNLTEVIEKPCCTHPYRGGWGTQI